MEALEFFTNQYGFLTPLLLPWLQKLCRDSAEDQLKVLFETELATPLQLLSCTNFSYRYIRENIIPRLIEHIEKVQPSPEIYLRKKLAQQLTNKIVEQQHTEQMTQQPITDQKENYGMISKLSDERSIISREELTSIILDSRSFELFLNSILSDLWRAYNVSNILCIETMMIIQYIRSLIYECEKNIKQNKDEINLQSYSGLICCNLLSILNDEYAHECVCDSEDTNLSNFKVFTDIINENTLQFPVVKNEKERIEVEMEKLERKIRQQQQQILHHKKSTQLSLQSMHTTQLSRTQTGDMLNIPHTPQISEVSFLFFYSSLHSITM